MLKKHSEIFRFIFLLMDMAIISISWILAYLLRFYNDRMITFIPVTKGVTDIKEFLYLLLFLLLPVHAIVFKNSGLYEPMRASIRMKETKKIILSSFLATFIAIGLLYLIKEDKYSRAVFIFFTPINIFLLSIFRYLLRCFLGWLRRHGFNLRSVLIIGDGKAACEIEKKLIEHAEYGFKVVGFITKDRERIGKKINNIPILGTYAQTKDFIEKMNIDQVILALPFEHLRMLKPILGQIYNEIVEIKIVPDLYEYFTLRRGIEILDGMPIINLRESPLYGWNKLFKRIFDILISSVILFLASPFMLLIALAIKLSSQGAVFYKQMRMGLDGRTFKIIKFRSMRIDAEKETGPIWAKQNDKRLTRIGRFIRRFNLDEIPQFFNVLRGEMSIVGPRPERPEFMQEFKTKIPEYMLRHKMKAGITGWAQVKGLRGNTSLEERTKYDLYYIENWSLFFDLQIFLKSFIATKNAY